jgi:hypothetical protein
MAIRSYREPLPNPHPFVNSFDSAHLYTNYRDVFVVLEEPLFELYQADLVFLRKCGIDPFLY